MPMSPTQLSIRLLKKRGFKIVQVVERWNPHARKRQDLFGCIDVLAVGFGDTVGVQATSHNGGNVAARVRKVADADAVDHLRDADWTLLVHGWYKDGRLWRVREVDIS